MSSLSNNNVCLTWVYLYGDISLNPKHLENIMYKVEKNVPMPNATRNGVPYYKYPFFSMNVGDSFAVPVDPTTTLNYIRVANRLSTCICAQRKRKGNDGRDFSIRTDKVNRIIRVWRTA
jgi:hypothetical protein